MNTNNQLRHLLRWCALLGLAFLLSACSGKGDPGGQSDVEPFAFAEAVGLSLSTSGTLAARSGSDVVLSGANSDGIDNPILIFSWAQTDTSGYPVDLYERTSNSVAFNVPRIPLTETVDVVLEFTLTVTDSEGVTASDAVSVQVLPVDDTDHYLLNPNILDEFLLYVAAEPGTVLNNPVAVDLSLVISVEWTDRNGGLHTLDLDTQALSGEAPVTGLAGATEVVDPSHLFFRIPVPSLDADQVNAFFTGANREGRLEAERIAAAVLRFSVSFTQSSAGDVGVYLIDDTGDVAAIIPPQALDGLGDPVVPLAPIIDAVVGERDFTFAVELLRQQLDLESKLSATNYYDCIDPLGRAATLDDWLEYAGFNNNSNSVVDTVYVNNYDLGFGREMYVREDANGNVYSYVANYPNLENALSQRNDFAVVVMEFSPVPTGNCGDGTFTDDATGRKIVKFYAYVPDETTGQNVRSVSMNFDGRGEKFLPGVCTACHAGAPDVAMLTNGDLFSINAGVADLSASFMPWDLDSFLYTDTVDAVLIDPVYAGNQLSDAVTQRYSLESQLPAFRLQNQATLHTYTYDVETMRRSEEPIRMVHGWYGNGAVVDGLDFEFLSDQDLLDLRDSLRSLPDTDFDGSYIQPGWLGQEALYQDVYARHCRLCHVQLPPNLTQFTLYDEFIQHRRLRSLVFEQGGMPASRLTMDRLWVSFYGGTSAAEQLRAHLNSDILAGNDIALGVVPGRPAAVIIPAEDPLLTADVFLDFDQEVLFDGTQSLFADVFEWRIDTVFASSATKLNFVAGAPSANNQVSLLVKDLASDITSASALRRVSVNNYTPSAAGLASPVVTAGELSLPFNIFSGLCAAGAPDSLACRGIFGDIEAGNVPLISIVPPAPVNGNVSILNATTGEAQFTSTAPQIAGNGAFTFTLTDSFGEVSPPATVSVTVNSSAGPSIGGPDSCIIDGLVAVNFNGVDDVDCPDPSDNDSSTFTPLTIVSVDGSSTSGAVTLNSGEITYQTPSFFFNGLTAASDTDSFGYTVRDTALLDNSGSVTVTVNATTTFTNIVAQIVNDPGPVAEGGSQCNDCHFPGNLGGIFVWADHSALSTRAVLNHLTYLPMDVSRGATTSTIDLLNSRVLQYACGLSGGAHTGGNQLCLLGTTDPLTEADLNTRGRLMLQWIREGVANN